MAKSHSVVSIQDYIALAKLWLVLNPDKTNYRLFTRSQIKPPMILNISRKTWVEIKIVKNYKYLGVLHSQIDCAGNICISARLRRWDFHASCYTYSQTTGCFISQFPKVYYRWQLSDPSLYLVPESSVAFTVLSLFTKLCLISYHFIYLPFKS